MSQQALKPVAKRPDKNQRRERWPEDLAVEQEVIELEEVKENPEAFRCIGEEVTEMLDYQPAKLRQMVMDCWVRLRSQVHGLPSQRLRLWAT